MQQQFISQQPVAYPATSAIPVQSLAPQAQSVIPTTTYQTIAVPQVQSVVPQVQSVVPQVQSVVPQVQSVVPQVQSVVPQVQSVVPSVVPQMQSVVPSVVPQVQSVVPSVVPQVQSVVPSVVSQVPITPYVQPIGSRHPIEQNHIGLGLAPGTFNALGGSPYGRISQIPGAGTGLVASTPYGTSLAGGLNPANYAQHVEILRNACQGAGTNEDDIIKVIASTNPQERALIRRLYNQKYNEDLAGRLQSELSGDFKEAVLGSFMTPTEYDSYCLNGALKGIGTKEGVLTEIIGSRTPQELQAIKQVYAANYGELLENHIASETSGDHQKLLLALLQGQRSQSTQPDMAGCQQDAAALYQAGEGKWGTDEDTFVRIFSTRSPSELALINQYYKQNAGKGLLGAIDSEFSGDTKDLLNTIVRSNVYPQGFYAKNIYDSVKGAGTNDSKLIRNVCARHAVDLPYIKQAYQNDYGSDMLTDIQGDTSGRYRQVISSLVANAR